MRGRTGLPAHLGCGDISLSTYHPLFPVLSRVSYGLNIKY